MFGYLLSLWNDIKAIVFMLFLKTDFTRPLTANLSGKKYPIILLHGSSGNQCEWLLGWNHITNIFCDYPCWAFSLDSDFNLDTGLQESNNSYIKMKYKSRCKDLTIEEYTSKLEKRIDYVKKYHNTDKVILFGHSMGGLVACLYKINFPSVVYKIITFGSPLLGTPLLNYRLIKILNNTKRHKQMTPGSNLLKLVKEKLSSNNDILTIGSKHDYQVPDLYSTLPGLKHISLKNIGHGSMITLRNVFTDVYSFII